ncbi:MAG TPA: VOC family protein [Pseudonocardiaceae bacterium]
MTPTLNAIGLVVTDLATAAAFYRHLGLEFPLDNEVHSEVVLAGGIRLMLDTEASVRSFSDWQRPTGSPRAAIAFEFPEPAGVDAAYATLLAAGGSSHLAPWDAPWRQRYASVRDPDGNGVDLYAAL